MLSLRSIAISNLSLILSLMFKDQILILIDVCIPSGALLRFVSVLLVMSMLVVMIQILTQDIPDHQHVLA